MVMTEVAGRCVVESVCVCTEDVCMYLVGVWQYASVCVCAGREGGACVSPDLGVLLSSVIDEALCSSGGQAYASAYKCLDATSHTMHFHSDMISRGHWTTACV